MSLMPVAGPSATRPVHAVRSVEAGSATVAPAIKAQGGDEWTPSGMAKWAADKMVKVGGDIKKLPLWEKVLIAAIGFFVGWKLEEWVNKQVEKNKGETWDKEGQDRYLFLKSQGKDVLLAEIAEPHGFFKNVTELDIRQKKWGAFCTFTVLQETQNPTLGDYNGKPNAPVALIALSGNKTASDDAIRMLKLDIERRVAGAPAKAAFYADVIKNLKDVHGVTVSLPQS